MSQIFVGVSDSMLSRVKRPMGGCPNVRIDPIYTVQDELEMGQFNGVLFMSRS